MMHAHVTVHVRSQDSDCPQCTQQLDTQGGMISNGLRQVTHSVPW